MYRNCVSIKQKHAVLHTANYIADVVLQEMLLGNNLLKLTDFQSFYEKSSKSCHSHQRQYHSKLS
uniref:Uncharacterized protein n=1 Tax=Arion vulgaris TaxID=1028688 RepID=A0A0B6Z870_9EUPU